MSDLTARIQTANLFADQTGPTVRALLVEMSLTIDALAARVAVLEEWRVLHDMDEAQREGAFDETGQPPSVFEPEPPDAHGTQCCECDQEAVGFDEGSPFCAFHYRNRKPVYERWLNQPDELPEKIKAAVADWLKANQQDAAKLRHGIIPLGAAQNWIERMEKATTPPPPGLVDELAVELGKLADTVRQFRFHASAWEEQRVLFLASAEAALARYHAARSQPRVYDEATLRAVEKRIQVELDIIASNGDRSIFGIGQRSGLKQALNFVLGFVRQPMPQEVAKP